MKLHKSFLELAAALALYCGLLIGAKLIDRFNHPEGAARFALTLLPVFGGVAVLWVTMRAIRRMDELGRRVQFEAIGFAFAATALATFGYGFLENAGLPRFPVFAVWPLMGTAWIIGAFLAARRYK